MARLFVERNLVCFSLGERCLPHLGPRRSPQIHPSSFGEKKKKKDGSRNWNLLHLYNICSLLYFRTVAVLLPNVLNLQEVRRWFEFRREDGCKTGLPHLSYEQFCPLPNIEPIGVLVKYYFQEVNVYLISRL